jgi:hypothetical protein
MPLPNPTVATAFLNGYITVREAKWNSTWGYFESWYKDTASEKVGDAVVMNRNFFNPKLYEPEVVVTKPADQEGGEEEQSLDYQGVLQEWVKLLSELGKGGRQTSLIGATFHAIRTYTIDALKKSEMGDLFNAHIIELRNQTHDLDAAITDAYHKKSKREDVVRLEAQYRANLLLLCDLGDKESIITAARTNLFGKLIYPDRHIVETPFLDTLNENIPFYYHENFHLIHFETILRHRLSMTFEDFESRARRSDTKNVIIPTTKSSNTFASMFKTAGSYIGSFVPGSGNPSADEGAVADAAADQGLRRSNPQ